MWGYVLGTMTAVEASPSPVSLPVPHLEAELNFQRKAALAHGGAVDHAGRVHVSPARRFDLGRTIFGRLQGTLPRLMMKDKLGKDVFWSDAAVAEIEAAYALSEKSQPTPPVDADLVSFMVEGCDFSMEHADGTFLEHLVFCHDYAVKYFPGHSAKVALLHSILGTATNTFPMPIARWPSLKERLTDFEALHIEAFPSVLRLFYDQQLLSELGRNLHRLDRLEALHCHRVIDDAPLAIDAENLWIQLNYHLMHFVDFMPAANWGARLSDPLLRQFRELSAFLDRAGQRRAKVDVAFPEHMSLPTGETATVIGRVATVLPPRVTTVLARKTIRRYSELAGHSLDYRLEWR